MSERGEHDTFSGSVAAVIDRERVVINRGSEHGVVRGAWVNVLPDHDYIQVHDPETSEHLDSIPKPPTAEMFVYDVRPRCAVCQVAFSTVRPIRGARVLIDRVPTPVEVILARTPRVV